MTLDGHKPETEGNCIMTQLTIDGVLYNVVKSETADDLEATRPHTEREMRRGGTQRILVLQRPRGKKFYMAYDYGTHPYRAQYRILG